MLKLPERWLTLEEFRTTRWINPEMIIAPWLPVGGLSMIFGAGGVGKTYLSLACAMSIAEGRSRVPYMHVPRTRRVLYVDGEMQPAQFAERFGKLDTHTPFGGSVNFAILSHAAFRDGLPDILKDTGQRLIWEAAQETRADVLFLDNISALVQSGDTNNEEAMRPLLAFLMRFRRANLSVVIVHHTGHLKPDEAAHARGTSSFNDKLDAALWIKSEKGKTPERIPTRLTYTKHRFFVPPEEGRAQSCCFNADDTACWFEDGGVEEPEWLAKARTLRDAGMSNREIAVNVGVTHPTVGKYLGSSTIGELGAK